MASPSEGAMYGMITTVYFIIFMYQYNKGRIVTDKRALVNIALTFMLAQPLCRILGGTNGLISFVGLCMSSIILLPSPQQDTREKDEEEKKRIKRKSKKETKTKTA